MHKITSLRQRFLRISISYFDRHPIWRVETWPTSVSRWNCAYCDDHYAWQCSHQMHECSSASHGKERKANHHVRERRHGRNNRYILISKKCWKILVLFYSSVIILLILFRFSGNPKMGRRRSFHWDSQNRRCIAIHSYRDSHAIVVVSFSRSERLQCGLSKKPCKIRNGRIECLIFDTCKLYTETTISYLW